jgi:hypothetical protein
LAVFDEAPHSLSAALTVRRVRIGATTFNGCLIARTLDHFESDWRVSMAISNEPIEQLTPGFSGVFLIVRGDGVREWRALVMSMGTQQEE